MKYEELLIDIIKFQSSLAIALITYNYTEIEYYQNRIAVLIRKILQLGLLPVDKI